MIVTDETVAQALPLTPDASVRQDVTFTEADVDSFGRVSGDRASLHFDERYAIAQGFSGRIVHGLLLGARFSRLMGMFLPGENSVIQTLSLRYRRPVRVGTRLTMAVELDRFSESVGAVMLKLSATADGQVVLDGTAQCVLCRPHGTG